MKRGLAQEELAAIAAYGAKAEWPEGFSIYQRASPADGIFIVLAGGVALRTVKGKRRFVPALVFAGETFGCEGLTRASVYVTDAQATEPTETLYINGSRFRALLRERPAQALVLLAQAFAERAGLLQRVHEVCASSVDERVWSALLRMCEGRLPNGGDRLVLGSSDHRLLCEVVGATRESITHALGRLLASGVAAREGTNIVISRARLRDEIRPRVTLERQVAGGVALEPRGV